MLGGRHRSTSDGDGGDEGGGGVSGGDDGKLALWKYIIAPVQDMAGKGNRADTQ